MKQIKSIKSVVKTQIEYLKNDRIAESVIKLH